MKSFKQATDVMTSAPVAIAVLCVALLLYATGLWVCASVFALAYAGLLGYKIYEELRGGMGREAYQLQIAMNSRAFREMKELINLRYKGQKELTEQQVKQLAQTNLELVAYHEAGHLVAAHECERLVVHLYINSGGDSDVRTMYNPLASHGDHNKYAPFIDSVMDLAARQATLDRFDSFDLGWVHDFEEASYHLLAYATHTSQSFDRVVANAYRVAGDILAANQDKLTKLAQLALDNVDKRVLAADLYQVLGESRGSIIFDDTGYASYQLADRLY